MPLAMAQTDVMWGHGDTAHENTVRDMCHMWVAVRRWS